MVERVFAVFTKNCGVQTKEKILRFLSEFNGEHFEKEVGIFFSFSGIKKYEIKIVKNIMEFY